MKTQTYIDSEVRDQVKAASAQTGLRMDFIINAAVQEWLDKHTPALSHTVKNQTKDIYK